MKSKSTVLLHVFLIIGCFIMIFPFIWMILCSSKTVSEITSIPITIFPQKWSLDNFKVAINAIPVVQLYINTFLLILGRVVCALLFSSMAAYGFARLNFPGKNALFSLVLIQMMVPGEIFIIPQYLMVTKLGLLDTIPGLIFPGLVSAFGTFLLRQQFMSLPKALEEAAMLDGCNRWQIFYKVMLPISVSGLVSIGVFTVLFAWKDLMWPLIVNMDLNKMPLAAGLANLGNAYKNNPSVLMAGTAIAVVPMLIIYAFCQKQFIEGIAQTGIK